MYGIKDLFKFLSGMDFAFIVFLCVEEFLGFFGGVRVSVRSYDNLIERMWRMRMMEISKKLNSDSAISRAEFYSRPRPQEKLKPELAAADVSDACKIAICYAPEESNCITYSSSGAVRPYYDCFKPRPVPFPVKEAFVSAADQPHLTSASVDAKLEAQDTAISEKVLYLRKDRVAMKEHLKKIVDDYRGFVLKHSEAAGEKPQITRSSLMKYFDENPRAHKIATMFPAAFHRMLGQIEF